MRFAAVAFVVAILCATSASAQNGASPAPAAGAASPPPKSDNPAPVVIAPPPPVVNEVGAVPSANDTVVAPPQQQVPSEPVSISPDAQYPNGFADPDDPFANDAATAAREESGFSWGLLGLLGLLGLIPLFRKNGRSGAEPRRGIDEGE